VIQGVAKSNHKSPTNQNVNAASNPAACFWGLLTLFKKKMSRFCRIICIFVTENLKINQQLSLTVTTTATI
jgi:hypothetical protein